jgi:hypothetical protein
MSTVFKFKRDMVPQRPDGPSAVSCVYSGKDKVVWCVVSPLNTSVELLVLEDGQ